MLIEQATDLDGLLDAISDVDGAGQIAAVLTQIDQQVTGITKALEAECVLLEDEALPVVDAIDGRRIKIVVGGCDKLVKRIQKDPRAANEGTTWSALEKAGKALVKDVHGLVVTRWRHLVDAEPVPNLNSLLDSLLPGAPGTTEFRRKAAQLEGWREKETPQLGDAKKVQTLVSSIRDAREVLIAVPDEFRAEYVALVNGTLPLSDFNGPIQEFVREHHLEARVRVRLEPDEAD